MKTYIAGPMSACENWNIPAFADMAERLRRAGINCINPHDLHEPDPTVPWDWYLRRDLKALTDCGRVVFLPGWERSRGATLEHHVAKALGLELVYPHEHAAFFEAVYAARKEGRPIVWRPEPIVWANYDPSVTEPVAREGPAGMKDGQKDTNPKDAIGITKTPFSTVPAPVVAEIGLGMMEGALKYGRHNYRVCGVRASVYYDAALRHLTAWWEGEDIDPDSGLSHLVKAAACCVVLRDSQYQENWVDDRPPRSPGGWVDELNKRAKALLEKYPDPVPPYTEIGMRGESSDQA